jgi:DNA polymerase-3 subunit beta
MLDASLKNTLIVRATNLETGVEIKVPAEIIEEGTVAIPVSILSHTIRAIRAEKIELTVEDDMNLTIHSAHGTTKIKSIATDEFPSLPKQTNSEAYTIPYKAIIDGVNAVSYAASQSMIRPELASILIANQNGSLVFAATDSFRLAEKTVSARIVDTFPDTLIPVKNALELVHVLGSVKEEIIECRFDENQLSIHAGSIYFVSRIIDGTFPQYREIIPKSFTSEAVLLKEDMNAIIKKARIFSFTSQQIGFHLYPSKKQFTATARTADIGETSDSIEAALSGDDIDINFNLQYLSDCFSSIHSDSISMQFGGIGKPLVIKGISDPSFLYLAMPLNR